MKPSKDAGRPSCWEKPSRSYTPLTWALLALVTGPIWAVAVVLDWLFALPKQATFYTRLWSARLISDAIAHLRGDRK
jgi:hypothetical protein